MKRNTTLLGIAAAAMILVGVTASRSYAAEDRQYSNIVEKIAEHFNLNKDEVQDVFTEVRQEKDVEMRNQLEEKLSQEVENGKISEDKKSEILQKMEEMHAQHDEVKNMTPEERKAFMDEHKDEMEALHQELGDILPFNGMRGMHHMH